VPPSCLTEYCTYHDKTFPKRLKVSRRSPVFMSLSTFLIKTFLSLEDHMINIKYTHYSLFLFTQCETQLPLRVKRGGIQHGGRGFTLSYQQIFRQNNLQCFIVKFREYGKSCVFCRISKKIYIYIENQWHICCILRYFVGGGFNISRTVRLLVRISTSR